MSVTAGVRDTVIVIRDHQRRGRIVQTKVKRYWPGRAPEWADDSDEDEDMRMMIRAAVAAFPTPDIAKIDDPRLRRLAESKINNRAADHRRAEIVEDEDTEEDEDEDVLEESRKRMREKLLQRQQEEEEEAALVSEESEYETDSYEEEPPVGIAIVYVPKSERDAIGERERLEAKDHAREDLRKKSLLERKIETKKMVVEEIRKAEHIQKINMEAAADIDTDVENNEAEEYEAWKVREIARIKRERDDRETMLKRKKYIVRVGNMIGEEIRREWERKNPNPDAAAALSKPKRRFMQTDYHKGAFYQTESDDRSSNAVSYDLFHRDYSAPTGEDKMDKMILPKVMQVKRFGRRGRTKWTHLVNEDTTDCNNL